MRFRSESGFLLLAGAVALVAHAGPARAEGEVRFGSQWWRQGAPDAKFEEFREVPRGGFLEYFFLR